MATDSGNQDSNGSRLDSFLGFSLNEGGSGIFVLLSVPSVAVIGNAFDYAESDWSHRVAIWLALLTLVTISAARRFSTQGLGLLWYILCLYVFVLLKLGVRLVVYDFVAMVLFALLSCLAYTRSASSQGRAR